jgi:hypothetical protein
MKDTMSRGIEVTNPTNNAQITVKIKTRGNNQKTRNDSRFEIFGEANFHAW